MKVMQVLSKSAVGVPLSGIATLGSLGITFDSKMNIDFDVTTLQNSILYNLDDVRKVFGFNLDQSNTVLNATAIPSSIHSGLLDPTTKAALPFTVTYDLAMDGVTYTATMTQGATTENAVMNADGTFSGPVGSIFEGFSFAYDGPALTAGSSVSTTFTATQGVASLLCTALEPYFDSTTGLFTLETTQYTQDLQKAQDQMTKLTKKVEEERKKLNTTYAKVSVAYAQMEENLAKLQSFTMSLYPKTS